MTSTPTPAPGYRAGSQVARGPMAQDHYTQVHNLAVRGAIHTRYVGVYAYICSHREGWRLTAAKVAAELDVGVDFVTAALKAIEAAGCLIRARLRDAKGQLGGSVWFVTDLALQLRHLGITDDKIIADRVAAAYEQWQATHLPDRENPVLAPTSENTGQDESFPRSEPKPGFPNLAEPDQANPMPKKNKLLEDFASREDQDPPPCAGTPAAAAEPGEAVTRGRNGSSIDQPTRKELNAAVDRAATLRVGASGWSPGQIRAAVRTAIDAGDAPADVVTALDTIAADPGTRAPGRLRHAVAELVAARTPQAATPASSPAPSGAGLEGPFRYLDNARPRCRRHPGHPADNCGPCRVDARVAVAEDSQAAEDSSPPARSEQREAARAEAARIAAAARATGRAVRERDRRPTPVAV